MERSQQSRSVASSETEGASLPEISQPPYAYQGFHRLGDYMDFPESHAYFNKQSTKVNSGLNFGSAQHDGENMCDVFAGNKPLVDIDFSAFFAPPVTRKDIPDTKMIVQRLMNPPPYAFVHGTLSLNWIIGVAGAQHFERENSDERLTLTKTSELRTMGRDLGLPAAYHEWLCGGDIQMSGSEQGMLLTKEFFEKEI